MTKITTLEFLEELRRIAKLGLAYTNDSFDRVRYEDLLALAAKEYAGISQASPEDILTRFNKELGHVTPKVGVNAAIFKDEKMFLSRRTDDNLWELPGGWSELGESPRDSLKRELVEELSLDVMPREIIEVFHRYPGQYGQPYTTYHLLFHCTCDVVAPQISSEVSEFGFFEIDQISEWHRDHQMMAQTAIAWRSAASG